MPENPSTKLRGTRIILLLSLTFFLLISPIQAFAQDEDTVAVQELSGRFEADYAQFYLLQNLKQGDTLYVYMESTSGTLDPFVAISDIDIDPIESVNSFNAEIDASIEAGEDPLVALPEIASQFLLRWDDDSGDGYDAAMGFPIPADGTYHLWVGDTPVRDTFGDFRLLIGINTPQVLNGDGQPTGDTIAILDSETTRERLGIQEYRGSLSLEQNKTIIWFNELQKGDELFVFIEATDGDLKPMIILRDFGNKPLRSGNLSGTERQASLSYFVSEPAENYSLEIAGCCDDSPTSGEYRLLVGLNAPEVLSGKGEPIGIEPLNLPREVMIGIRLQQITDVDQISENYSAVVSMRMEWTNPKLAFSPVECNCTFRVYPGKAFDDFITAAKDQWPEFTIFNQQGNRWIQNRYAVVESEGRVVYFERFSTTFQAPDFNFVRYPFDTQQFFIHVDSAYPEEFYFYNDDVRFTDLGDTLGEEEWLITEYDTEVSTQTASTISPASRYSYGILATRHINYYLFRIFIPLLLIIIVAWITFFLKDYGKRIDVTTGNLLLFIAFNFTISSDLPRLGYLTFLDSFLISTFIISVIVVLYNVVLKRLEVSGMGETATKIDSFMIWLYPLAYLISTAFIVTIYFI
jgi:hypothetical protein